MSRRARGYAALAAIALLFVFGSGCIDDALVSGDRDASVETDRQGKLRHAHLLGSAAKMRHPKPTAGPETGGTPTDGMEASGVPTVGLIIGFTDDGDPALQASKFLDRFKLLDRYTFDDAFNGLAVEVDQAALDSVLAAIEADPDVEWVEPDVFVRLADREAFFGDYVQRMPWGIDRVGAPLSSQVAGDGTGAVAGVELFVMDSGVHLVDLEASQSRVMNFSESPLQADAYGHGTHVAGTAAALDDAWGFVGVAPGATIWSVKVLDENGQTTVAAATAAVDAIIGRKLLEPLVPMVVNISFGADVETTEYNAFDLAVAAAIENGIVVVVAGGNEAIDVATVTPAHVEEAITVGAFDVYNRFADFSNFGPGVDLVAPGVDILSTARHPDYGYTGALMSGTSSAAPHVAGAAALYLSQYPEASPAEVRDMLVTLARDVVWNTPPGTTGKALWVGDL